MLPRYALCLALGAMITHVAFGQTPLFPYDYTIDGLMMRCHMGTVNACSAENAILAPTWPDTPIVVLPQITASYGMTTPANTGMCLPIDPGVGWYYTLSGWPMGIFYWEPGYDGSEGLSQQIIRNNYHHSKAPPKQPATFWADGNAFLEVDEVGNTLDILPYWPVVNEPTIHTEEEAEVYCANRGQALWMIGLTDLGAGATSRIYGLTWAEDGRR